VADLIGVSATLASSLFAGAAIYINFVEHPARMACGTELAARQWAPSYKLATIMQVSLVVVATLAGFAQWLGGGGTSWLVGALLIVSVIPFTLVAILPTNRKLLEPGRDNSSEETRRLLEVWGRLHAVRSVLSLVATLVYLHALVWSRGSPARG
jgi:Anthrone oxygenase